MDRVTISFCPNGVIRAIDSPQLPIRDVLPEADVFRASHLLPINDHSSRYHGWYYADLSPLADAEGNDRYRISLYPPQPTYQLAREQEEQWLLKNYLQTPPIT